MVLPVKARSVPLPRATFLCVNGTRSAVRTVKPLPSSACSMLAAGERRSCRVNLRPLNADYGLRQVLYTRYITWCRGDMAVILFTATPLVRRQALGGLLLLLLGHGRDVIARL